MSARSIVSTEAKFPSLSIVLQTLDNLSVKKNGAEIHENDVAVEVQRVCPNWKCKKLEAERLAREYLQEGEMTHKCYSTAKLGCWKMGRRPPDEIPEGEPKAERKSVRSRIPEVSTTTSRVQTQVPIIYGDETGPPSILQQILPTICADCCQKNKHMTRSEERLNSKEIMALITAIMKRDEDGTNDVHCLCDKCLGSRYASPNQIECRRQGKTWEKSGVVERNMALFRKHTRKMEEQAKLYRRAKRRQKRQMANVQKSKRSKSKSHREKTDAVQATKSGESAQPEKAVDEKEPKPTEKAPPDVEKSKRDKSKKKDRSKSKKDKSKKKDRSKSKSGGKSEKKEKVAGGTSEEPAAFEPKKIERRKSRKKRRKHKKKRHDEEP